MGVDTFQGANRLLHDLDVKSSHLYTLLSDLREAEGSICIIVSTLSGTGQAKSFYESHLVPLLDKYDLSRDNGYTTHLTDSASAVTDVARDQILPKAKSGQMVLIILLSGDGGIVDVLNVLAPYANTPGFRRPIVALLPFGTGNALASSAKIALDETYGLGPLCTGSPKALPNFKVQFSPGARLLVDEGKHRAELPHRGPSLPRHPTEDFAESNRTKDIPELYGAVVCSWCFHAAIVADSDTAEYRKHGSQRFQMAAQEALNPSDGKGPHEYAGNVWYRRNEKWTKIAEDKHAYLLATEVSNLEKAFTISPASEPLSGKIYLVHLAPLPADEIMAVMTQAYDGGKHVDHDKVDYEEIDGLWIDFKEPDESPGAGKRWRRVCVDGTIVEIEEDGWIYMSKVQESSLEVLVPAS